MKTRILLLISALLFLSGCATYNFRKGESPYDKGFVASRYDRVFPEYTLGKDNSVPADENVAKERFQRRRQTVENYYKKMGYIENRFKQNFIDPPIFIIKTVLGIFWWPAIAINDYKYNHDPKYKESVDKQEDAEYLAEKERIKVLKDQLNAYIQEDLKKEPASLSAEQKTQAPATVTQKVELPPEVKEPAKVEPAQPASFSEAEREAKQAEAILPSKIATPDNDNQIPAQAPTAVIIAKPQKGPSPLFVQFNGAKSSSPNSRIVSYVWDFGDGDSSTKKNPTNTYWSTTYGSRKYTATLTVTDAKGRVASASTGIEIITK